MEIETNPTLVITNSKNNKIVDFTKKIVIGECHLLFRDYNEGDVFWWGICLVTFTCLFDKDNRKLFDEKLKENGIIYKIIDNHSDKEFLILFDYEKKESELFNNPIIISNGVQPCVNSVAETMIDKYTWFHLSNVTNNHRNSIANMYKTIYELFKDKINTIEIVRDLYNKEYILV